MKARWSAHALKKLSERYGIKPSFDELEESVTALRLRYPPFAGGPAQLKKRVHLFGKWMRVVYERNMVCVLTVLPDGAEPDSGKTFKLEQFLRKEKP